MIHIVPGQVMNIGNEISFLLNAELLKVHYILAC